MPISASLKRNTGGEIVPQAYDGTEFRELKADAEGRLVIAATSNPVEQRTVSLATTGDTYVLSGNVPAGALRAQVFIEGGRLRVKVAGTAASALDGILWDDGDAFELESPGELTGFTAYALEDGVKLHIVFYGV